MLSLAAYAKPPRPSFLALAQGVRVCNCGEAARRMRQGQPSARMLPGGLLAAIADGCDTAHNRGAQSHAQEAHKSSMFILLTRNILERLDPQTIDARHFEANEEPSTRSTRRTPRRRRVVIAPGASVNSSTKGRAWRPRNDGAVAREMRSVRPAPRS